MLKAEYFNGTCSRPQSDPRSGREKQNSLTFFRQRFLLKLTVRLFARSTILLLRVLRLIQRLLVSSTLTPTLNGRWSVEKFKGLMFAIERDANAIGQQTRRGKGNMVICSADVASALQMAGVLDYTPALNNNLNVDDTQTTFAGVMNGRYKVYVDPYSANVAASQYYVVGYKGTSPYDAGMFYCPYVPLQMVRAVGEDTFQPKMVSQNSLRYGC